MRGVRRFIGDVRRGLKGFRSAYFNELPSQAGGWDPPQTPNSGVLMDRQKAADRVRQLLRKMPWMEGSIDNAIDYKVGEGFAFRPAVIDDDGRPDAKVNRMLKDAFLEWCEDCTLAGGMTNFGDVQRLMMSEFLVSGEAMVLHRYDRDRRYVLKGVETDCLNSMKDGDCIEDGVEYDPEDNRVLRYHLIDLNNVSAPMAMREYVVDARDAMFLYRITREEQRRGISRIAPYVSMAYDFGQYLSNELASQQMASRWLAFITDPNAESGAGEAQARKVLYNLTMEYLPPGKQVQLAPGVTRPTMGVDFFKKMFLQAIAMVLKVPYYVLSQEYTSMNYNTLREVRNNIVHLNKHEWNYIRSHFLVPVYRHWLDNAVLRGDVELKGYFSKDGRRHYSRAFFMPPGIESVDVLRDIKGVIEAANNGLMDPQDWIMSQGEDPDEVVEGIAQFREMLKARNIEVPAPGASSASVKDDPEDGEEDDEEGDKDNE